MSDLTEITDHAGEAVARLPMQHRDQPGIEAMVRALAAQAQEIETAIIDLLLDRTVETAIGVHLDRIGDIVGETRDGETDDEIYRRRVRARIYANRSSGTAEELIRIVHVLQTTNERAENKAVISRQDIAHVVVKIEPRVGLEGGATPAAVADVMIAFLRDAKVAGVRLILESTPYGIDETFVWDTGPGWDQGRFVGAVT